MDKDVERLNPSRLPIVKCCPVILSCRERESVELMSRRFISCADLYASQSNADWSDLNVHPRSCKCFCIRLVASTISDLCPP
jgi:hypothetical protein